MEVFTCAVLGFVGGVLVAGLGEVLLGEAGALSLGAVLVVVALVFAVW